MINRRAVITRHSPLYKSIHKDAPLSVGNGTFCFTADYTGLQSFFNDYAAAQDAFPLCTMAEWGWHSYPLLPEDKAGLRLTPYDTNGRSVLYATDDTGQEDLFKRIRVNAHKFHLGVIGFDVCGDGLPLKECIPVSQFLSLWEGILFSEFFFNGETVKTETFVHPNEDTLYIRSSSALFKERKLRLAVNFPYGSHKKSGADFSNPVYHTTSLISSVNKNGNNVVTFERKLDTTLYYVIIEGCNFTVSSCEEKHTIAIHPQCEDIELCIRFGQQYSPVNGDLLTQAQSQCRAFWEHYWNCGGFVDFSDASDSRVVELERRMVLSQYLIAIQSRGCLPPAETGHTCNSWYGKFHMEMYYWHHAHFALWGRSDEIKRTLEYYKKILPLAKDIAASQGYTGARWPKMCDPSGDNTPSSVAVLLLWQQPHPIMLAELCWRADPNDEFLREYRDVIVETAEFMKSFIHWEEGNPGRYSIGPPYFPAQERHDPRTVLNAPYELEYFRWGFKKADEWLVRLGERGLYGEIAEKLSMPAIKDGVYLAHENCPDTFTTLPYYTDHPSMLAMYGILDSDKVDPEFMSATLDKVLAVWDKETFYGWDFPMMAMTACRLGRYEDAVNILLMESPKNTYMENGHNRMVGDNALPLYLPGNGGLLLAIAMLAAGHGEKKGSSFPQGFTVKSEGLHAYI